MATTPSSSSAHVVEDVIGPFCQAVGLDKKEVSKLWQEAPCPQEHGGRGLHERVKG